MPIKNHVKQFLDSRKLSAYQFIKDTGIAPATGYALARDVNHLPSIRVLEAICDRYRIQPEAVLQWVDEAAPDELSKDEVESDRIS